MRFFLLPLTTLFFFSCSPVVHLNPQPSKVVYFEEGKKSTEEDSFKAKLSAEGKRELSKVLEDIKNLRNGIRREDLNPFGERGIF